MILVNLHMNKIKCCMSNRCAFIKSTYYNGNCISGEFKGDCRMANGLIILLYIHTFIIYVYA